VPSFLGRAFCPMTPARNQQAPARFLPEMLYRACLAAELVWNRVRLPRRYERSSLDGLFGEFHSGWGADPRVALGTVARDFQRIERLLTRVTPIADTCLYRAMARYVVLARAGFPAVFVMGIPRTDPDGVGHAWVEVNDTPFSEPASVADFAVTFRYPPERSAARNE
jgi:hypothetical protein